jgi:hypothetical protein
LSPLWCITFSAFSRNTNKLIIYFYISVKKSKIKNQKNKKRQRDKETKRQSKEQKAKGLQRNKDVRNIPGMLGQHKLHGCAAHGFDESDCCAGPIQMGYCSGDSITIFS